MTVERAALPLRLTSFVAAVVVALWVARIPLFEDSLTVPVVVADLLA